MKLQPIDIAMIVAYLATMVVIGWVLRKKARRNKENYLLGGKSLPWYMLGLSDASDMFDISGTGKTSAEIVDSLKHDGILAVGFGKSIRMVTHCDVSAANIDETVRTLSGVMAENPNLL